MQLKPIRTKQEYQATLKAADALWNAKDRTADADWLKVLTRPARCEHIDFGL